MGIVMNALRVTSCALLVLHSAVCLASGPTSANDPPGDAPRNAVKEFQKPVPGLSAAAAATHPEPAVAGRPCYWECSDGHVLSAQRPVSRLELSFAGLPLKSAYADHSSFPAENGKSALTTLVTAEFIACTGQLRDGSSPKPTQS
jgi:hypothetical protein